MLCSTSVLSSLGVAHAAKYSAVGCEPIHVIMSVPSSLQNAGRRRGFAGGGCVPEVAGRLINGWVCGFAGRFMGSK